MSIYFELLFDNSGGTTAQSVDFCHFFGDGGSQQAAEQVLRLLSVRDTLFWEGNEPEHRVSDSSLFETVLSGEEITVFMALSSDAFFSTLENSGFGTAAIELLERLHLMDASPHD